MLRLVRDGHVTQIQRPIKECFWYMPNPPLVNKESSKLRHFLGIADLYLKLKRPKIFIVEPKVAEDYRPDVYMRDPEPVIIEYQRSPISNTEMQSKIDRCFAAQMRGDHDASIIWIASAAKQYKLKIPQGISVAQFDPTLIDAITRQDKAY